MPNSRLEIDLSALARNHAILRAVLDEGRAHAPQPAPGAARPPFARTAICGVIKQDAYGLGAVRVARKLAALGVEMLAVYSLDEARALADEPITAPVLVLMPVRSIDRADPVYRLAVAGRLHFVLHDPAQAAELAATAAQLGCKLPVHVQLDTGITRGGCGQAEARSLVEMALAGSRLSLAGVMTHFASPATDEAFTREQARVFRAWYDSIKPTLKGGPSIHVHAANTAAAVRSRSLHGTMVRIGQGFYGLGGTDFESPSAPEFAAQGRALEPAARWLSRIVHVREIPAGTTIGYGRTFKAERATKVALVPVGYADGYPVALSNLGVVALTGERWDRPRASSIRHVEAGPAPFPTAKVIGRVSMDQLTIDVTDLPAEHTALGAEVELFGRDPAAPNHLPTLARAAGTITHELLCRLSQRIERIYTTGAAADHAATEPAASLPITKVVVAPQAKAV